MNITQIPIANLHVSPHNVRKEVPDVSDLVSSIASIGLLQPITVRKNADGYEIVAGQRRFLACKERGMTDVPCVIIEANDAGAVEASLAENFARAELDPLEECEAFMALKAANETLTAEDIAGQFGLSTIHVMQRLKLAELPEDVRAFARKKSVPFTVLRALTMATPAEQKAWKAAWNKGEYWATDGQSLRNHLSRGKPERNHAVFDVSDYTGTFTVDLFEDKAFFNDEAQFDELQQKAVEIQAEKLRGEGWLWVKAFSKPQDRPSIYEYGRGKNKSVAGAMVYVDIDRQKDGDHKWLVRIETGLIDPATVRRLEREKKKAKNDAAKAEAEGTSVEEASSALSNVMTGYFEHLAHRTNAEAILGCKEPEDLLLVLCDLLADSQVKVDAFSTHKCASGAVAEIGGFEPVPHLGSIGFTAKMTKSEKFRMLRQLLASSVKHKDIAIKRADLRDVWTPTGPFFAKLDKERLAVIAEEIGLKDTPGNLRGGKIKKTSAIQILVDAFSGSKNTPKDVIAKAKTWVPADYAGACAMREYVTIE